MISWIRPSAPSAELTEVIAPKAWPSGTIIRNRKRMNAIRFATVMVPLATRNPPTPSTTRNDTCMAIPAIGTTSAEIFATWMPIFHAPTASSSTAAISRSVAFEARTVRTALMARSTLAARSPTFTCAARLATRIRCESRVTVTTDAAITSTVSPSSTGSITSIAISAPRKVSDPPIASTSPWVSTARSRVVSEPTRETRSPVRRVSNSLIGRRSIRPISLRRLESTTPSPVRCSR